MADYPKKIKRLLHEWMVEAYERELHRELTKLDRSFSEWRDGKISSGELSYRLHQYERGPSRELYSKYNQGDDDMNVAHAIAAGILNREEIPAELLEALQRQIGFYQSLKDENRLAMPE